MDDLPIDKIQISGPTLSSLLNRFSSSTGDIHGLLFGHVTLSTTSSLSDHPTTPSTTPSTPTTTLTATITSFLSTPSSTPLSLSTSSTSTLIGWFSGRRKTHIRPSLHESSFTSSLSSNTHLSFPIQNNLSLSPCLFLLLTTPFQDQIFIHTHEYKAFQFRISSESFEPRTLDVVNIGPALGGHYGNFTANSRFPMMGCELRGVSDDGMVVENNNDGGDDEESLSGMRKGSLMAQKELDLVAQGFEIERLGRLVGPQAANYTSELEDLYDKMLAKLDGLARLVEKSSAQVFEQENNNMKLRCKVAGLE